MNYPRNIGIATQALACLLIAGCGDKSGNSNSNLAASQLQPSSNARTVTASDQGSEPTKAPQSIPAANQPPTISGTAPAEATVGQQWTFVAIVADPDGDTLNVTASNLPGWMSLNQGSGMLSGTPTDGDVQTWTGISLTVSDGVTTSNLPPFAVDVLAPNAASGSATLSWLPPTERLDGTPVGDLAGYVLVYGQNPGDYTQSIIIDNPGITSYMVEGLTSGDWYFAIRTVDASGLFGPSSGEARATI